MLCFFLITVKIYHTFHKLTFKFFHWKTKYVKLHSNTNVPFEKNPQQVEHCISQNSNVHV